MLLERDEHIIDRVHGGLHAHNLPGAPHESQSGTRYTLYLEGEAELEILTRLDARLRGNPQYALCRDLGQLLSPAFLITESGYETFVLREMSEGKRLGEIKPRLLSMHKGWSERFNGVYSSYDTIPIAPELLSSS